MQDPALSPPPSTIARYDTEKEIERYRELAARLRPLVVDGPTYLHKAMSDKKRILVEGANALMLDLDFGTYPFVTSSNTGIGGVLTGLGVPPAAIGEVTGVVKAYTTRVGAGPFPTEQLNVCAPPSLSIRSRLTSCHLAQDVGVLLQEVGAEYGTTTGRRRRCGWLDLVVLKYSTLINGYTSLNLTKLDVLDGLDKIQIGVAYTKDGEDLDAVFPADLEELGEVSVRYVELPGWKSDITGVTTFEGLPENCRKYVEYIENFVGVPVKYIGTGPARESMITRY